MKITLDEREIDEAIKGYLNPYLFKGGMSVASISVNRLQGSYNAEISCEPKESTTPKLVQPVNSEETAEEDPSVENSEDEVQSVFS